MRNAEQKLDIVLDALNGLDDGVVVLDHMARFVAANKRYYDLVLTPDQQAYEGESSIRLAQRIAKDGRVVGINQMENSEALLTILSSTFSYVRDFEAALTDGRVIGVNSSPSPNGNMVMWFREKSTEQLGEQRALDMLSDGLSSVDMGMILWDETLIVQSFNASWAALTAPVKVGQNCREMFAGLIGNGSLIADRPIHDSDLDQLIAEIHTRPMRFYFVARNQRQIQISTFFTQSRGIFATAVDVTEHRRAQEKARTMLSDAVQALDVGVIHFDADGELQLMNRAARDVIYGDRAAPPFGTSLSDFATDLVKEHMPRNAEPSTEREQRLLANLRAFDTSFRPPWVGGRVLEFCPHRTDMGGILVSVKDLTAQQAMQAELSEQREAAAQNEKLSALGELLAEVAHELSNPMSVVLGYSQMLGDQVADPKTKRRVDRITDAAERCGKVLKTFLAMARQRPVQMEPCDVAGLIHDAVQIPRSGFRASGVDLRVDIQPGLPNIAADGDQIIQVLINLMMNALQELGRHDRPGVVTVSARSPHPDWVEISVADNGDGVPEDIRRRIFEPFFTTKDVGIGTGIGLAFCHRTISSHDGTLTVDSGHDGGAVFRIVLPAGPANAAATAICSDPEPAPARKSVLVLDDEPAVAELIQDLLEHAGFDADIFTDGWAALDRARHTPYDVLLVDIRMPGLNGQEFLQRLKSDAPQQAERLIFLTGDALNARVAAFLADCGRPHIEKPVSRQPLLTTLRNMMGDP